MKILIVLAAILSFFLCFFSSKLYFKYRKNEGINKLTNIISTTFFGYIIIFGVFLYWTFNYSDYSISDFSFVYAALIIFQTILLILVFGFFKSKSKFYLVFFIFLIFFILFFTNHFIFFTFAFSFLFQFIVVLFVYKILKSKSRSYFFISIIYFLTSFLTCYFSFFKFNLIFLYLFSNLIILFVIFTIDKNLVNTISKKDKNDYSASNIPSFVSYFVFIVFIVLVSLISSLVVHEFGHVLFAKIFDCPYKTIFFESGSYPYTEILCKDDSYRFYALISGPTLPFFVFFIILFFGGKLLKDISFLFIGFNFIASFRDISELNISFIFTFVLQIIGFILLILGVISISKFKFEDILDSRTLYARRL